MASRSRPNLHHRLIVLGMLATAVLTAPAIADPQATPLVSTKVRTIPIGPQSTDQSRDPAASSTSFPKVRSLTVRRRLPGEQLYLPGPSPRDLVGNPETAPTFHVVPTTPVRPEPNGPTDPGHIVVQTTRVPVLPAPQ